MQHNRFAFRVRRDLERRCDVDPRSRHRTNDNLTHNDYGFTERSRFFTNQKLNGRTTKRVSFVEYEFLEPSRSDIPYNDIEDRTKNRSAFSQTNRDTQQNRNVCTNDQRVTDTSERT